MGHIPQHNDKWPASMQRVLAVLKEARSRLEAFDRRHNEPVAIIGMGCRFPGGADDPDMYWQMLRSGVDAIREVPKERWDIDAYYDPDPSAVGKMYTRFGGFLHEVDYFDAQFFGISPREAKRMDPQQRLLLEVSREALEHAGQPLEALHGSSTGLFLGISSDDYLGIRTREIADDPGSIDAHTGLGASRSIAVGRLAYTFGFHGPALQLDTSCSSSLLAVHLACQSLRAGESSLALAGGVNLMLSPEATLNFCKLKALSPDGRCKTFDASADGYARGEGCGIVVLKLLSAALADGDPILAQIRGSAVNHDGHSNGLTAPNGSMQEALIRRALRQANVEPNAIGYIEVHGTGTSLGDPIEVKALSNVLGPGREKDNTLFLGSVKTNFGHLEGAAGVAGLMKAVLALQHRAIPPHLHFQRPNPYIPWDRLPIKVNTELTPWPDKKYGRLAGVSSFGMSGTNVHVILEQAPKRSIANDPAGLPERPLHILHLSAHRKEALVKQAERYRDFLVSHPAERLADICYSANVGRSQLRHRLALVADTREAFGSKLDEFAAGRETAGVWYGQVANRKQPKIAFLFTGQGSQYVGMGRQLFETQSVFRRSLQYCDEILRAYLDQPLLDVLYPADAGQSLLDETLYTQPALFALEISLAELWKSWGVEPAVVLGHSVGEYAAACVAGVFSLEDGLTLIAERARLMQKLPSDGEMLAVFAAEDQIREQVEPFLDVLAFAVQNGPTSTVISGKRAAIRAVRASLQALGIHTQLLNVSHAFHSPLMEPMLADFEKIAASKHYSAPRIPLISNLTAESATAEIATAHYWCRHVREPVRFADGIRALQDYTLFLEIGPKPTLLWLARQCLPELEGAWLASLHEGRGDWQQMLKSLAQFHVHGVKIDWQGFDQGYPRRKIVLPGYPYQKKRYAVRSQSDKAGAAAVTIAGNAKQDYVHPLLGCKWNTAGKETIFESKLTPSSPDYVADHRIHGAIVLPGAACMEMSVAAAAHIFHSKSVIVEDVFFQSALILPDETAKIMQTIVRAENHNSYTFGVYSRSIDSQQPNPEWSAHATGKLVVGSDRSPIAWGLAELKNRCSNWIDVSEIYLLMRQRGYHYGHNFQALHQLWGGTNEALGEIRLSDAMRHEIGSYYLHPALLDACFHVVAAALAREDEKGATFIPLGADRIRCYGHAGAKIWSYVRLSTEKTNEVSLTADLKLLSEAGRTVAEIDGLQFVQATPEVIETARVKSRPAVEEPLYVVQWKLKARGDTTLDRQIKPPATWLVLTDKTGVGENLVELLRARQQRCIVVVAASRYAMIDSDRYAINPADPQQFSRLIDQLCNTNAVQMLAVVHLWSLDAMLDQQADGDEVLDQQMLDCGSVLHVVQGLARSEDHGFSTRLWLVTQGAQPVNQGMGVLNIAQSSLLGLGRVIALEHPEMHCVCVDLDAAHIGDAEALVQELMAPDQENQVALRQGQRYIPRLVRHVLDSEHRYAIRADANYLITGGLGALGLNIAKWLVDAGAKHVVLTGRRGADSLAVQEQEKLAELRRAGAQIRIIRGDVTSYADVQTILSQADEPGHPLRGIVHAAGVLDDDWLLNLNWQRFRDVMAPKVSGTWNLHRLTRELPLDFFVCFSSIASILGTPGQGNYAAANAFMDAMAYSRRLQGLSGLSVNWGPWAGGGFANGSQQDWGASGMQKIQPEAGLTLLQRLLEHQTHVAVAHVDWPTFVRRTQSSPLLEQLVEDGQTAFTASSEFISQLRAASFETRRDLLFEHVRCKIAAVLNLQPDDPIPPDQEFLELGLDSLTAVELRNLLQASLGQPLSLTTAFRHPTLQSLVDYLHRELILPNDAEALPTTTAADHAQQP